MAGLFQTRPSLEIRGRDRGCRAKRWVIALLVLGLSSQTAPAVVAGPSAADAGANDDSAAVFEDSDPTDADGGTIYDLDAPGCSFVLPGDTINHTSEVYINFSEYAVVTLDKKYSCSNPADFYYEAQVDADNKVVNANKLGNGSTTLPASPFYTKR